MKVLLPGCSKNKMKDVHGIMGVDVFFVNKPPPVTKDVTQTGMFRDKISFEVLLAPLLTAFHKL